MDKNAVIELLGGAIPDAIIAATALVHDLVLITRNTVDFDGLLGLETINPLL